MMTEQRSLRVAVRRHSRAIFLLALSLYTLFLIYTSFSYSREARMFPLIANVLLIGLILVEALFNRYGDRLHFRIHGVFSKTNEGDDVLSRAAAERNVRREVEMVGWIVGFIFVIWLFGFLSSFLLVPLFVYVYERDLRMAIYTLIVIVVLLNTFVYVLSARLWDGVIFGLL